MTHSHITTTMRYSIILRQQSHSTHAHITSFSIVKRYITEAACGERKYPPYLKAVHIYQKEVVGVEISLIVDLQ